ncbi:MAG: 5'-nucleotidase C-terminal domain-containing protein [Woeseiaceae bacterium]|nr:5'-nucleotidase C-terminal domain-containing protein [Woeseiaceae bacterium]
MRRITLLLIAAVLLTACTTPAPRKDVVTLSLVGLNDVHGQLQPDAERRGLVSVSAYIEALRNLRKLDGGAVLLIDAGDMFQGTLESNLEEGVPIIEAYNSLGVAATAIGNHEFDFGPIGPDAIPTRPGQDPRGALKARARDANFPFLAANLVDVSTGELVDWDNVYPSVMLDVAGFRVGVVGVTSMNSLQTTIAANVLGLRLQPIAEAIVREATRLRADGAELVIVSAHAGSRCTAFDNPRDTSSCWMDGEIMRVARELPAGLVDHIVAGHVHEGIAHVVNGISITSSYSSTRAFSRTDFVMDRSSGSILDRRIYPPQVPAAVLTPTLRYEGQALQGHPEVAAIVEGARVSAEKVKLEKLGVTLTEPFRYTADVESALSNLMTEAILDSFEGDIAIHNVIGGIRNSLPAGELTFGAVYEMFPFDNLVTIHEISGATLREIISRKAATNRKPGIAGMRVFVSCEADGMQVVMRLDDGREIRDEDRIRVIANDFLALGGDDILTPAIDDGGLDIAQDLPRTRDALLDWLRQRPGQLDPAAMHTHDQPKWNVPASFPDSCVLQSTT